MFRAASIASFVYQFCFCDSPDSPDPIVDRPEKRAGRKIGSFDQLKKVINGDLWIIDERTNANHDFTQIVRRNISRHADSDTRTSVYQEIRKRGREDGRLLRRIIVVWNKVDRVFVHILHQNRAKMCQLRLGIPHGRRRIAVHRSKVSLAFDENFSHCPRLSHMHERGVNGHVTVRVIITHRLANDLGAFTMLPVREESQTVHRVQDAPLGGL